MTDEFWRGYCKGVIFVYSAGAAARVKGAFLKVIFNP
jgi:hypothetical protein